MFRRFSVNFAVLSMFFDAALVAGSLGLATYLRPLMNELSFAQRLPPGLTTPLPLYPIFAVLWVLVLLVFSVYDGRKNFRFVDEFASLTAACSLASIASAGGLYLSFRDVSRLLFLVFISVSYLSLLLWRMAFRMISRKLRLPASQQRVIILGYGDIGNELREKIEEHPEFGLAFVGFLDDVADADTVIGYLSDARRVIEREKVDDVVFALPGWAYNRVNTLVGQMHDLPVKVWVIPDYFSLSLHRAAVEEYAGIPMLDLRAPALSDYQRLVKRAFDLALTLVLLPPTLILMGVIAAAIRLESPGPILFRQPRVGENGRIFKMIKFRSMVQGAEQMREEVETKDEEGNPVHKSRNDPRVTRLGHFLRRTSLDELPQLFNVLKGEMSLVGPRPELPYLVDNYETWQRARFAVPPGLTGWWQITGRSDKPMHLHTEDDLYYVQNYSLALDISILLRTFWVVLTGRGAY